MSDVIVELKKEREALRNRLAKIDAAIEDYERWARSVAGLVGGDRRPTASDVAVGPGADQTPIASFEEEVRALFSRVSAPLRRAEVYEALTEAGVVVGGKDPLNTVAARLSRMDGITNLKGHGYWAEDRPYAPAGYRGGSPAEGGLFDGDDTSTAESDRPTGDGEAPTSEA